MGLLRMTKEGATMDSICILLIEEDDACAKNTQIADTKNGNTL